jgi:hypothetical protein
MMELTDHDSNVLNDALAVGDEIEQLMVRVISSQTLAQDDVFEQYISAMAVRCLNFLRATLILSRQGLAQPASGCVRSLIEQRWVFGAVAAKDTRAEALQRLKEHGDYNRKQACKNLRKLPINERDNRITDEALSEVEASLGAGKKHCISNWAELAKYNSEYQITYALLCDRMHPSSFAIEEHLILDDSKRVRSVTANPDFNSLPRDILQACEVMIDVFVAGSEVWQTENVVTVETEFRQRIEKLWQKVPDPLAGAKFSIEGAVEQEGVACPID